MLLNQRPNFNTYLAEVSDGIAGVRQTLRLMSRIVRYYKSQPEIRDVAISLTGQLAGKDFVSEVATIFVYVRDSVRYIMDVDDMETIQTPDVTLSLRAGDCDDKSVLLATLLSSIGHPTRFHAVGFSPNVLEHVFVETKVGTRWVALDATEPYDMGWAPPDAVENYLEHN